MMKIQCPKTGLSAAKCLWLEQPGQVRDAPEVGVVKCQNCSLVTHSSDLSGSVSYESGSMHNWTAGYGDHNLTKPSTDIERRKLALLTIQKTHGANSVLDFGCGSGEMLSALSSDFQTFGIEPDRSAREKSQEVGGVVWDSASSALETGLTFDVVTMFHVVEHLYEPFEELKYISTLLKPGGLIVIETPNANDALLTKYELNSFQNFTYWSHHPMLHSHESLATMVLRNGFSIVENVGLQRYDLANHLYWLAKGQPGGHDIWSNPLTEQTKSSYADDLVRNEICDTLWLVAKK